MKIQKLRRSFLAVSYVGIIVSMTGCVSFFTRSFTAQVVDSTNQPLSDAFVIFDYSGGNIAGSYSLGASMVKTGENGKFTIPSFVHFHNPIFETGATPDIMGVYSPTTHSFVSQGDFLKDFNDQRPSKHRATLPDNTGNSGAWANSLHNVVFAFDNMLMENKGSMDAIPAPRKIKKEFVDMLQSEFDQFNARYGKTSDASSVFFKSDESSVREWQKELHSLP